MFWKSCLMLVIGMTISLSGEEKKSTETTMTEKPLKQYFIQLLPQRPDWPNNMTDKEKKIWADHFAFLKDLTEKKLCLAAGPVFNDDGSPWFGMIILLATSLEEAQKIMENEPGTVNGITTYTIHIMNIALWDNQFTP